MAATQQAAAALIEEAERLAERGWRLFPCAPRSKVPRLKGWQTVATSDLATIRKWAAKYPGCNWAVATGKGSGVFVLDVDGEKGRASLATLEGQHWPLPDTLTSQPGRVDGGEHRWFKYPAGCEIRCSASKLGQCLDIRAAGGYVIVAPSIHETGRPYQWVEPQRPVADAPTWMIELLADKTEKPSVSRPERFGILTEGKRNDGLARYGGALRRRRAELAELEDKLLAYNVHHCQPPLEEKEVRKIAASMTRYPVGGPDPLELAWQATQAKSYPTRKAQFLALCRHLQNARPGLPIALPIERIGELMGVHWTSVSGYRKEAVRKGFLTPVEQYLAHRLAGQYRLIDNTSQTETKTLTKPPTLLTSGLVRIIAGIRPSENGENFPSENCSSTPPTGRGQPADLRRRAFPKCPRCGSFALYRQNNLGKYVCLTCDLVGIEESIARDEAGPSGMENQHVQ